MIISSLPLPNVFSKRPAFSAAAEQHRDPLLFQGLFFYPCLTAFPTGVRRTCPPEGLCQLTLLSAVGKECISPVLALSTLCHCVSTIQNREGQSRSPDGFSLLHHLGVLYLLMCRTNLTPNPLVILSIAVAPGKGFSCRS